jgi:hypothetical protein
MDMKLIPLRTKLTPILPIGDNLLLMKMQFCSIL